MQRTAGGRQYHEVVMSDINGDDYRCLGYVYSFGLLPSIRHFILGISWFHYLLFACSLCPVLRNGMNMHGPKHISWEAPNSEPNTDQPEYDSDQESSPRLEGDTSDDEGREELD